MMRALILRLLGVLLTAVAAGYLWSVIGPAVVEIFQSGDPDDVARLVLGLGAAYLLAYSMLQMIRVARSSGSPKESSSSEADSAREAAIAMHGPRAGRRQINEAAERILVGWSSRQLLTVRESCRHEAAHAIVAFQFGAIILGADVDERANGHVRWVVPPEPVTAVEDAWMRLCVAISGNVLDHSEGRFNPGSFADFDQINRHVMALISIGVAPTDLTGPLTVENILSSARQTSAGILSSATQAINEIARLLESRGSLTGHQVHSILSERKVNAD